MSARGVYPCLPLAFVLLLVCASLSACVALPPTPDQAAQASPSAAPTATPSPPPSPTVAPPSAAPLPTEPPSASAIPSLGYDCSQVERLPVDSPEARLLAEALVASYRQKLPSEYIAVAELYAVERLGEYAVVQMRITDEAAGIFVIRQTPPGASGAPPEDAPYEYLGGFVRDGSPLPSRFTIPEILSRQAPDAPAELIYCLSLEHYFFEIPAEQELDLRREYDCSRVASVPPESPAGQALSRALRDYWAAVVEVAPVELEEVHAIQQLGPYLVIQVRFRVNGRPQTPEIFIAVQTPPGFQFVAQTGAGGADRAYILRDLHAQHPPVPPELLACLALDAWALSTPTPAP